MSTPDDAIVEVREFYERGPLRVRCHDCAAPLFPGKDGSAACDGQNFEAHGHVNVYHRMVNDISYFEFDGTVEIEP